MIKTKLLKKSAVMSDGKNYIKIYDEGFGHYKKSYLGFTDNDIVNLYSGKNELHISNIEITDSKEITDYGRKSRECFIEVRQENGSIFGYIHLLNDYIEISHDFEYSLNGEIKKIDF